MSSAEVPDTDAIDQRIPVDDVEGSPLELSPEVNPPDAVDQHRDVVGDDAEDYPPG